MKLDLLVEEAAKNSNQIVAVAVAENGEVIDAIKEATELNMASFRLYGNEKIIHSLLNEKGMSRSDDLTIIDTSSPEQSAQEAVKAVCNGQADVLMKGMISTSTILKAVLNKEFGLRTGRVLSHVAVFDVSGYEHSILVTDAAMNIAPDLEQKAQIVQNAVTIASAIGIQQPKVAPIAAIETVNPDMQATLDAASLTQMNQRGQIKGCIVDGPLALDNAVSIEAADQKGIYSDVAGRADILLVPTVEVGNVLYKSLIYFARAKVGAVIAGAKAPIVLTSRADTAQSKLYSIALAITTVRSSNSSTY
jgi:phosphate butyryltransferase